jgi:hypothetical protein
MTELWHSADDCSFLTRVVVPTERSVLAGAPREVWTSVNVGADGASVDFNVTWVDKTSTKLPEAVWVKVTPVEQTDHSQFELEALKLGAYVDVMDVVKRGSVNFFPADAMRVTRKNVRMTVTTLDAPITGVGPLWPFPVRDSMLPEGAPAFAFNLNNNIWGTNFINWYPWVQNPETLTTGAEQPKWIDGGNATYRFTARWSKLALDAASQ